MGREVGGVGVGVGVGGVGREVGVYSVFEIHCSLIFWFECLLHVKS